MNKKALTILVVSLLMCGPMLTSPVLAPPPNPWGFVKATTEGAGPITIDPAACYDTASAELIMNLCDTLMFFDGEHTDQFLYQIATTKDKDDISETSPDGLPWCNRYTFTIRTNVPYHNPAYGFVTPADVEYCFERLMVMDLDPAWTLYEPLLNGASATYINQQTYDPANVPADRVLVGQMIDHAIESDATTVWFNLAFSMEETKFLQILCRPWTGIYPMQWCIDLNSGVYGARNPANPNWDDVFGSTWWNYHNPPIPPLDDPTPVECGAGPFKLKPYLWSNTQWEADWFYTEDKPEESYWGGWPANWPADDYVVPAGYVAHIVVSWLDDWPARKQKFLDGQVDFCAVPSQHVSEVLGQFGIESVPLWGVSGLSVDALFFNFDIDPTTPYGPIYDYGVFDETGIPRDFFGNLDVRKAFAYAFDYNTYLATVWSGEAVQPATAIIQGLLEYSAVPGYTYNPALAQVKFMAVPGLWATGFTITVAYNQGNLARQTVANLLKTGIESLNPTKFHVVTQPVSLVTYMQAMIDDQFSAFQVGWMGDLFCPDADEFAYNFYHSSGYFAKLQGYLNLDMNNKVDAAADMPHYPPRTATFTEIQTLAIDDCPSVALSQKYPRHFQRNWVIGYHFNQFYGDDATYFYPLWKMGYGGDCAPFDVNYDGIVNMRDIGLVCHAFYTFYGPPISARWHFRCDFNNDRKIDMADIGQVAKRFGQTFPTWLPP